MKAEKCGILYCNGTYTSESKNLHHKKYSGSLIVANERMLGLVR